MTQPRLPLSFGTVVLGGGAVLLGLFLLGGFLLAGTWEVTRHATLSASPAVVFPHLDAPLAWQEWTTLPDTGLTLDGPHRGTGASMSWDHPEWGSGTFRIEEAESPNRVRYSVLVEDGAMRTDGTLRLQAEGSGTRVEWTETGDFGWNPLMGYWSLFMERAQGRELEKSLERLAEVVAQTEEAPADSVDGRPDTADAEEPTPETAPIR